MFKYEFGVFMHKLQIQKGILPVNSKTYFTSINNIHNYSWFSETNYYFPRVNSLYGFYPILDVKYTRKIQKIYTNKTIFDHFNLN